MKYLNKSMIALVAVSSVAFTSCKKDKDKGVVPDALYTPAAVSYATLAYTNYSEALVSAQAMQVAINAFVAAPTEATLAAAKKAWIDARPSYLTTEAFRESEGPIDADIAGVAGPEGALNGWPLDENYIDYVETNATSGLINDTDFKITAENLEAKNEDGGEANLSTGYHAIEFLLWGQDLSTAGPGARPATDYTTLDNADRRKEYLKVVTEILIKDLTYVKDQWAPDADNFRKTFLATPKVSLRKAMIGLESITGPEMGDERMGVAIEPSKGSQEDEHSCFSDNTHNDHIYDITGLINVYTGTYKGKVMGTSLSDIVKGSNEELDTEIKELLNKALTSVTAFSRPFDQAILNPTEVTKIQAAIDDLHAAADKIKEAQLLLK